MTNISRRTGNVALKWSPIRNVWDFHSSPVRRFRSRVAFRQSMSRWERRWPKASAWAMASPIRTIFTAWKRRNACLSAAKAARLNCACPRDAWRQDLENARGTRDDTAIFAGGAEQSKHFCERDSEDRVSIEWARKLLATSLAYFIDHRDGFKTTLFLMPIGDFNYAGLNGETRRDHFLSNESSNADSKRDDGEFLQPPDTAH